MSKDINTKFKIKDYPENLRQTGYPPVIPSEWNRYRILEIQKARCRNKIKFHTENLILQSIVSFLCVVGGIYAGQKRSVWVPLVLAPIAATSCSKLATHTAKRMRWKDILNDLERN